MPTGPLAVPLLAGSLAVASSANGRTSSEDLSLGALEPGRYAEPDGGRVDLGEITVPP